MFPLPTKPNKILRLFKASFIYTFFILNYKTVKGIGKDKVEKLSIKYKKKNRNNKASHCQILLEIQSEIKVPNKEIFTKAEKNSSVHPKLVNFLTTTH